MGDCFYAAPTFEQKIFFLKINAWPVRFCSRVTSHNPW